MSLNLASSVASAFSTAARLGLVGTVTLLPNTFQGGSIAANTTARAVAMEGDPDQYVALGLVKRNPVTLCIEGRGLGVTLQQTAPISFTWGGVTYGLETAEPTAPDGTTEPLLWIVMGATA